MSRIESQLRLFSLILLSYSLLLGIEPMSRVVRWKRWPDLIPRPTQYSHFSVALMRLEGRGENWRENTKLKVHGLALEDFWRQEKYQSFFYLKTI